MAVIGIDWGTHSSKWSRSDDHGKATIGSIYSSTLAFDGTQKSVMFPRGAEEPRRSPPGLQYAQRLKRKMIEDPNASFWEGKRADSGMSLGASVVFSLCVLIREAWDNMPVENRQEVSEIAFSFPNWSLNERDQNAQALQNFRTAAMTAVKIFRGDPDQAPRAGQFYPVEKFADSVRVSLAQPGESFSADRIEAMDLKDDVDGTTVTYIMESVAAGLPYLERLDRQNRQVRRLLVVDAGAGSTDIGYMGTWRTTQSEDFYFIFFPPAPTCGLAGEMITQMLSRQLMISPQEAEQEKIRLSLAGQLHEKLPYLGEEWIPNLGGRVYDYLSKIDRHAFMRMPVSLNVILTGGSGAISDLGNEVMGKAKDGLTANRTETGDRPFKATQTLQERIELGVGLDDFETGRMAVSLGACWPQKKKLIFWRKLEDLV